MWTRTWHGPLLCYGLCHLRAPNRWRSRFKRCRSLHVSSMLFFAEQLSVSGVRCRGGGAEVLPGVFSQFDKAAGGVVALQR